MAKDYKPMAKIFSDVIGRTLRIHSWTVTVDFFF
jgi:hypothetical protein